MSTPSQGSQEQQFAGKPLRWWQRVSGTVLAVSILIHLFFVVIATYFVVSHFAAKPKPIPPTEAPAQRSEQVKVQMDIREKTMSAPAVKKKVTTTSPLAKVALPEMPDVPTENVMPSTMPGVSANFGTGTGNGNGNGNGDGIGADNTFFGTAGGKVGLLGTFYDFKQSATRRKLDPVSKKKYASIVTDFVRTGWNPDRLKQFFNAPNAVSSKMIFVPQIPAENGPTAFKMGGRVQPGMWMIHYRGKVIPPVTGRYHFLGCGDDVLLVALDGKLLLDACWDVIVKAPLRSFHMSIKNAYSYTNIPRGMVEGDAFDVEAGKEYTIDVAIGEEPGAFMFAMLLLEKEGVEPKLGDNGFPLFPILRFANAPLPNLSTRYGLPLFDPEIPIWSIWKVVPPPVQPDTNSFFHQP